MCVCIYVICIYAFLRDVREIDVSDGGGCHFDSAVALLGKFYITLAEKKPSEVLIPNDEILLSRSTMKKRRGGGGRRHRSKDQFVRSRSFAPATLGAFSSNVTTIVTKIAY